MDAIGLRRPDRNPDAGPIRAFQAQLVGWCRAANRNDHTISRRDNQSFCFWGRPFGCARRKQDNDRSDKTEPEQNTDHIAEQNPDQ